MADEELEKQDKQEQKEEKKEQAKRDLKIVITSIVCTLLFIIILLLLVLLGLKKCNKDNSGLPSSSGTSSSSIKYDYDTVSLNDKFKAIVKDYMDGPGGMDQDNIVDIKTATYVDDYNDGYFSLNISATSENNKLYLYKASKVFYPVDKSRFDNLVSYLLLEDTPNIFELGNDDTKFECYSYTLLEETLTTDKKCSYVISKDTSGTKKFFDGFYYENNQYYVYHHQELINNDPFSKEVDMVVGIDHPLHSYYQSLLA